MRDRVKQVRRWSSVPRRAGLFPARNTLKRGLQPRFTYHASRITFHFSFLACGVCAFATDVDVTKLPPPATNRVEFARDIKPIFQQSCLKCHGPEKPKSKFRLDNRDYALKGGNNGVDILPGDSANSPLIHNVAGLVEDMEMPPKGKAPPLTPEQIGLLRAWIDQGVAWEINAPEPAYSLLMSPTLSWTTVSGDEHKFREHYWRKEGWNGGAENFLLTDKFGKESKLTVESRVLLDDYRVVLTLEKKEVGFTSFGWEQYRKYFDDTGGYFPAFTPSTFSLDRDLHLDVGRAWADFGLTLPDWPRMVIGYEYQYRDGEKSTLQWGAVRQGETRNIYPSAKAIDEHVHIIKFDLDHEIAGVRMADSFRGEFYDLSTSRQNIRLNEAFIVGNSAPSAVDVVKEQQNYFQGANAFRLERSFTDWLFGSAGYLYSKLNADAAFYLDTVYPLGPAARLQRNLGDHWQSDTDILERETHAFNLTSVLGPWQGFTLSAGLLNQWTREKNLGQLTQDSTNRFGLATTLPARFDGDLDKALWEESLALRYTTLPFTVLFAEARLQQESIGQFQEEIGDDTKGGSQSFLRQTDATSDRQDFRAGFTTSPWQRVSLSAHYRHYQKESDYDHRRDESIHGPGYPAFIRWRDVDTDEVETKLVLRPCNWLKTTLAYKLVTTEYQTATDPVDAATTLGGRLESADYDAHVYSLNATVTPWQRMYLSGTFSYEHSRTAAFANDTPAVVPYRGDRISVLTSGNYALNRDTDLQAGYSFSWADYGQNNYVNGLPLGVNYQQHALTTGVTRRFGKNISGKLQYGFFYYDDPGSGGANNYTAHAVFFTLTVRLP